MKKICSLCEGEKDIKEFHVNKGNPLARCKCCVNKINREWYNENKEKKIEQNKKWVEQNKDKARASKRKYYHNNKEKIFKKQKEWVEKNPDKVKKYISKHRVNNKEKLSESNKEWREKNKDYLAYYRRNKRKTDPLFKLAESIRGGVKRVTKAVKQDKELRSLEYLGCSLDDFKLHIESLWSEGMSWANHGEWHIDHKISIDWYVKNSNDPWEANHYSNLQPLWAEENQSKGAR